jgi:hypothetical protein
MSRAELVVRKGKVGSSRLYREREAKMLGGNNGAFNMPTRSSGAEHCVPTRLASSSTAPQERVQGIALPDAVWVSATLSTEPKHFLAAQPAFVTE